jgi:hypothetical protein
MATGCVSTQSTAGQKEKSQRVAYEAVTPTGSNRILRQKKEPQVKDPHEEAVRNRLVDAWGRTADTEEMKAAEERAKR